MAAQPLFRLNAGLVVVVALIAIGVVADAAVVVNHLRTSSVQTANHKAGTGQQGQHPCNHGFYVSQAAHSKQGGGHVKQVAQGGLGKNGDCSAPLPAGPGTPAAHGSSDEGDS